MFRCTECHAEYEVKPDYCDCGNDTFEEIKPKVEVQKQEVKPVPKPQPQITQNLKPTYVHSKPAKHKQSFFDPASTIIFAICIILSFIVVFFVGNPKEEIQTAKKETPVKTSANIPSINSFWNNTLPKIEEQKTPEQVQTVQQPVPQVLPPATIQPKPQQKPITKIFTQPKQQTKNQVQQKATNTVKTQTVTKPQTVATKQQTTIKPSTMKPQTITQPVTTTPQQTVKQTTTVVTTPKINPQELNNYKINLRNKIANNINFANIIGDGSCTVSFRISNSGALYDKKFSKQSDNFTLNDVVHKGIMKVTYYNPPPVGYKNETMKLTVKMYNGNFEVSLY